MSTGKWIGGIIGFIAAGPLGALAGVILGSLLEEGNKQADRKSVV